MPAEFCLVSDKIMLENPHTLLMKTGSKAAPEASKAPVSGAVC